MKHKIKHLTVESMVYNGVTKQYTLFFNQTALLANVPCNESLVRS